MSSQPNLKLQKIQGFLCFQFTERYAIFKQARWLFTGFDYKVAPPHYFYQCLIWSVFLLLVWLLEIHVNFLEKKFASLWLFLVAFKIFVICWSFVMLLSCMQGLGVMILYSHLPPKKCYLLSVEPFIGGDHLKPLVMQWGMTWNYVE